MPYQIRNTIRSPTKVIPIDRVLLLCELLVCRHIPQADGDFQTLSGFRDTPDEKGAGVDLMTLREDFGLVDGGNRIAV